MAYFVPLLNTFLFFSIYCSQGNALSSNYYAKTCPQAEDVVMKVVKEEAQKDRTVPATLLRMHFHDCFLRGCDASILLSSKGKNTAEKDAPPNGSMHGFYVIDGAKRAVEAKCPGVVSCADILAFAARDAVVLSGGPRWDVPKGRKDGRISRASETTLLPKPTFNISQLQQSFHQRGLSIDDMVALLASLKGVCPLKNRAKNAGMSNDPSPTTFDNSHFRLILQKKSLLSSDHALLTTPRTKRLVYRFATSKAAFHKAFSNSMIKMSSLTGGQEVRKDCRVVN
ncbi:peroxidase 64 isoform X2 [Capsicum annuum]|uniref:peroxidase 64 isoform X2 n=1 Tax=Capsicum annuum TaxID=4072 RepID=UPI0007BFA2DD|nr:peroxidase 64 isoform X2 [Capsicum annuum]